MHVRIELENNNLNIFVSGASKFENVEKVYTFQLVII